MKGRNMYHHYSNRKFYQKPRFWVFFLGCALIFYAFYQPGGLLGLLLNPKTMYYKFTSLFLGIAFLFIWKNWHMIPRNPFD